MGTRNKFDKMSEIEEQLASKSVSLAKNYAKGPQYYGSFCAGLGGLAMGTVLGYSSPAIPQLESPVSPIPITMSDASWIGSLVCIGALFGGPLAGMIVENIGRKTGLISTALPFVLGWLIIVYAQNVWMLFIGRFLTGLCCGCVSLMSPTYISEIVHPDIRGLLGCVFQLMVSMGIVIVYVLGTFISWSWLALYGAVVSMAMMVMMITVPETPAYLLSKDRMSEAKLSLKSLRGSQYSIEGELEELVREVEANRRSVGSFLSKLTSPIVLGPLMMSCGLMVFQQFCGINIVIFYTVSIFRSAGSTLNENVATIIVGLTQLLASFISSCLMDCCGRKPLLFLSSLLMAVTSACLGVYFYVKEFGSLETLNMISWLPLVSLIGYVFFFSIGFGPIPWLMMSELFPSMVKGQASGIATAVNWFCAFLVTNTYASIVSAMGSYGAFWLFSSVCVVGVVFVWKIVLETKGKTFEQISRHFTNKNYSFMS